MQGPGAYEAVGYYPTALFHNALHAALDAAVLAAYGWPAGLAGDAILERLLTLNHARAASARA